MDGGRASKVFRVSTETINGELHVDVETQINSFSRTLNVRGRVEYQIFLSMEKGITTSSRVIMDI